MSSLLGDTQTEKNPTDRGKKGANEHDKWSADNLIISIVVPHPKTKEQYLCSDKGYDYKDVHDFIEQERYIAHIKHRLRRSELLVEQRPVPGEAQYPARRWIVERTLG